MTLWADDMTAARTGPPGTDDEGCGGVDDGEDGRDMGAAGTVTRREALTRATYGVGGLLLLRAPARTRARTRDTRSVAAMPAAAEASAAPAASVVAHSTTRLPGGGQPRAVCHGPSGVVVVGSTEHGDPVSWHSRDGRRWEARQLPPPARGDAEVWGVAAHGAHYVAVGSVLQRQATPVVAHGAVDQVQADVTFTAVQRQPTVWWTGDSATWTGRTVAYAPSAHAQLIAVSCNSDLLVAVGSTLDADGVQGDGGLVLISRDGQVWEHGEIATSAGLPEGSFTGVAAAGDRWFATSSDMSGGAVWSSDDGRRWSVLGASRRQFAGMTLQGLGASDTHVHVAATRLADHATRYYTSSDGCRTWRRLRPRSNGLDNADSTVTDLAVVAGDVVVVGTRGAAPVIEGGIADGGN